MTTIARSALHKISDELWEIAHANWKGFDHWAEEVDAGLLDAPRVRELGEQANRLGGFAAMSAVCKRWRSTPRWTPRPCMSASLTPPT